MIDFEKEFEEFVTDSKEGSAIQDIYKIIPSLTQEQMEIINNLKFFIRRYELYDLDEYLASYISTMKINKNLNFLQSQNVKQLLKAYTQESLIQGIRINSSRSQEE